MKQIIVNVSGLSVEEKQRVNEALAKITGGDKIPTINPKATLFLIPDSQGSLMVDWASTTEFKEPTHTPEEVLEMAGLTETRKVRKDFDPKRAYSVNVSDCTEDAKKEVQQAFFNAGFPWEFGGKKYSHLGARQYSNVNGLGYVTPFCMYGTSTVKCNMTPEEFFNYVYEPEQQGHVHAELMAQYAQDAKTTDRPWELWQLKDIVGDWITPEHHPAWEPAIEYRRKPKTKLIHGVEIPDIGIDLSLTKERTDFYTPCTHSVGFFFSMSHHKHNDCSRLSTLGLTYPYTEEGKQAAILHAKAMLGIN